MSFSSLGLAPDILRAVSDAGYTEPTPIQAQAIPVVLAGRDIMAGAQTGTGKTAAFALPLLHRLTPYSNTSTSPAMHPVRGLILTPTRELAIQVEESVRDYSRYVALRSTAVFGGVNIKPQIQTMQRGVEVLVATPGRLLDLMQQKSVTLGKVDVLVLDEADRMLDMGFILDLRKILSQLPVRRQNLLFSATFSGEIKKLADFTLKSPVLIEVARRNTTAETVQQVVHLVARERKQALLSHLIHSQNLQQVLVFSRTKQGANQLTQQLVRNGIVTSAIHGDKNQVQRLAALSDFKHGKVRVLVATDIAARGLDIEQLPHVVNYDLPNSPEDYIHRIGRTGRAGSEGAAISLVCPEERKLLAEIEHLVDRSIPQVTVAGFEVEDGCASVSFPSVAEDGVRRSSPKTSRSRPAVASRDRSVELMVTERYSSVAHSNHASVFSRHRPKPQIAALLGGLSRRESPDGEE